MVTPPQREFTTIADSNRSLRKRNRSLDGSRSKFRDIENLSSRDSPWKSQRSARDARYSSPETGLSAANPRKCRHFHECPKSPARAPGGWLTSPRMSPRSLASANVFPAAGGQTARRCRWPRARSRPTKTIRRIGLESRVRYPHPSRQLLAFAQAFRKSRRNFNRPIPALIHVKDGRNHSPIVGARSIEG